MAQETHEQKNERLTMEMINALLVANDRTPQCEGVILTRAHRVIKLTRELSSNCSRASIIKTAQMQIERHRDAVRARDAKRIAALLVPDYSHSLEGIGYEVTRSY
jgi:Zn-finger nucleic acid-binding protein